MYNNIPKGPRHVGQQVSLGRHVEHTKQKKMIYCIIVLVTCDLLN